MIAAKYRDQVLTELDAVPEEYLPFVLHVMRSFRETITLKSAEGSFRQARQELRSGDIHPIDTLRDGVGGN